MAASRQPSARNRRRGIAWFVGPLFLVLAVAPVSAASGWTGPRPVGPLEGCDGIVAAIDENGGYHVAAECGPDIRYASSVPGGWSTTTFSRPRLGFIGDRDPQIAIDGTRVYVAYSREDRSATCGISYLGVYFRWRELPAGRWSAATRIGGDHDSLQSLRVVGGTMHLTVGNDDEPVAYVIYRKGTLKRYPLAGATRTSSLRISNDGTARIVYEAARSLRYARFTGSALRSSSIPGTTADDRLPVLVLDAQDNAHVAWSHTGGTSCGDEPPATVGTHYATDRAGMWTAPTERRVTSDLGAISLTVDTATKRVHLLVAGDFGVKYFTKTPDGAWRGQRLASSAANGAVIRMNPGGGELFAVYSNPIEGVVYLTKP